MDNNTINGIAGKLHTARLNATPVKQFGKTIENFTRKDAYSIQETGIGLREKAGEKVVGYKMGLTSEAKRKQMDLPSPLYGVLTDVMQIENNGTFSMKGTIHPKIEPEVGFVTSKELKGNVSRNEVLDSCSAAFAALEILDSRYDQFKYFSMEEVISDNSSSSHYILGPYLEDFRGLILDDLKMEMSVDGEVAQSGISSAISGDPVVSVIQLCELLAERGQAIPAGSIILTGAATAAVQLKTGMKVHLTVEDFADVYVNIV